MDIQMRRGGQWIRGDAVSSAEAPVRRVSALFPVQKRARWEWQRDVACRLVAKANFSLSTWPLYHLSHILRYCRILTDVAQAGHSPIRF